MLHDPSRMSHESRCILSDSPACHNRSECLNADVKVPCLSCRMSILTWPSIQLGDHRTLMIIVCQCWVDTSPASKGGKRELQNSWLHLLPFQVRPSPRLASHLHSKLLQRQGNQQSCKAAVLRACPIIDDDCSHTAALLAHSCCWSGTGSGKYAVRVHGVLWPASSVSPMPQTIK